MLVESVPSSVGLILLVLLEAQLIDFADVDRVCRWGVVKIDGRPGPLNLTLDCAVGTWIIDPFDLVDHSH